MQGGKVGLDGDWFNQFFFFVDVPSRFGLEYWFMAMYMYMLSIFMLGL